MFDDQNEPKEKSGVRKRMEEFYSQLSKKHIEFFTSMMREEEPQPQQKNTEETN
jgi:hypothetical protein